MTGTDESGNDYAVGYRRPPKNAQFKKGQSGNPGGRPGKRGPTSINLEEVLNQPVTVVQDGIEQKMPQKEVELRRILQKALKGELKAIDYLLQQFDKYEAVEWARLMHNRGVAVMPPSIPYRMGLMLLERFGPPPWRRRQIEAVRPHYEASRDENEKRADEKGLYSYEP